VITEKVPHNSGLYMPVFTGRLVARSRLDYY
jgi:hypothetical protein